MREKILMKKRNAEPIYIKPGFSPSIVDIVVAMNYNVRERIDAQK